MLIPCEIAVKTVMPAIRAGIARELVASYNLKQEDVAKMLGISQSAVSKYTRFVRGSVLKIDTIEEIQPILAEMATMLANGDGYFRNEFVEKFCQTCKIIRRKKLMCPFCENTEPIVKSQKCSFCLR